MVSGTTALLGVLVVIAACVGVDDGDGTSSPATDGPPAISAPTADDWAAPAVAWRTAFYAAGSEGRRNVLAFLAEDVVFEDRIVGGVIRGREDYLRHGRSVARDIDASHPLDMFLSADGFLDQYYWEDPAVDLLDRVEMEGPLATTFVEAGSVASGRVHAPDMRDFDAIEQLADRYVSVWNDGADVAQLYADDVRLDDTLLGLSASGRDEVSDVVDSGAGLDLPPVQIADLPPHTPGAEQTPIGGPAIYIAPSLVDRSRHDEVHIVLDVDDGSGCPGLVAVSLDLADGRIQSEKRFHEVASVRRCRDVTTLQSGWWEGIDIPDPVLLVETDPMVWPERGVTVKVFNGTPEVTGFVRWGLERFDTAGLPLPNIGSVTFLVKASSCREYLGLYDARSEAAAISLCRTVAQTCADVACTQWRPAARHTLLHEYAHAWMHERVDEATRQRFLRFSGVDRWDDPEDEWAQRGMEQAADAIAYGLLGMPEYRAANCERSLEGFRLLTGHEPLTSCP